MRKDNVDWKEFASKLLWCNIVYHKNEYSGYDIITDDIPENFKHLTKEQIYQRGYKPGDIVPDTRILSYWIGPTKQLSWKELALELGLFEDLLIHDGHDCNICKKHDKCTAFFKDDPDHERCNGFMKSTAI